MAARESPDDAIENCPQQALDLRRIFLCTVAHDVAQLCELSQFLNADLFELYTESIYRMS